MTSQRTQRGGTLALVASLFIGLVLIVAFVVLNYQQLFTHQKEAQTAIDAAALAVAKEVAKVTITHPRLGKVALVDDYGAGGLREAPVYGINTLLARARLDLLIADGLGNSSINFLIDRDMRDLTGNNGAMQMLKNEVEGYINGSRQARDAKNNVLPRIDQVAVNAYNSNDRRLGGSGNLRAEDFVIALGTLGGGVGVSNIPVPQPVAMSQTDGHRARIGNTEYYKAYENIPVSGHNYQFVFSAMSEQPRLIDRSQFRAWDPGTDAAPPSVVRVTCNNEQVSAVAAEKGGRSLQTKVEVACANVGGRRVTPTSGIFRVEFPQGIPAGGPVDFGSIVSIMNESQLPSGANSNTQATGGDWRGRGRYFTAQGGPFPGDGQIVTSDVQGRTQDNPSVSLAFYVYHWLRNEGLRPNISSVVKALRDYDLRSAGGGESMTFTANADLLLQPAFAQSACQSVTANPPPGVFGAIFDMAPDSDQAFGAPPPGWYTPHINNPQDPNRNKYATYVSWDPRALTNFNSTTRPDYLDQAYTFRMQMSVPQQLAYAGCTAMAHGKDSQDNPTTVDGGNIYDIVYFRLSMGRTQQVCTDTYGNARKVADDTSRRMQELTEEMEPHIDWLDNKMAEIIANENATGTTDTQGRAEHAQYNQQNLVPLQNQFNEQNRQFDRAATVMNNVRGMIQQTNAVIGDLLPITARGLRKANNVRDFYLLATSIEYAEPTHVATEGEIRGQGSVTTGQRASGQFTIGGQTQTRQSPGDENWVGSARAVARASSPVAIAYTQTGDPLFMPVYAQILGIQQMRNFKFVTNGDASQNSGAGLVSVQVSNQVPFTNTTGVQALLPGQSQYQALNIFAEPLDPALKPEANLPDILLMWSIMSQDNVSNTTTSDNRKPPEDEPGNLLDCGRVNTDPSDPNQKACDNEAVRFQVTSPLLYTTVPLDDIPVPPPPPNAPDMPTPRPLPPPPPPPPQGH